MLLSEYPMARCRQDTLLVWTAMMDWLDSRESQGLHLLVIISTDEDFLAGLTDEPVMFQEQFNEFEIGRA